MTDDRTRDLAVVASHALMEARQEASELRYLLGEARVELGEWIDRTKRVQRRAWRLTEGVQEALTLLRDNDDRITTDAAIGCLDSALGDTGHAQR